MRNMPFRFVRRVRNLEIKTYCPTRKKQGGEGNGRNGRGSSGTKPSSSQQMCPSCVLPVVVAFIFGFTVMQLIVIHRTIVAYKSRSLAFEEVYGPSHNDTKSQGELLAFSKKFSSAWLAENGSRVVEWKPDQSYPYRIPGGIGRAGHYQSPINHIWNKGTCPEVPTKLHGNISINTKQDLSLDELARNNAQVLKGGKWTPEVCEARYHVALIIPYRYRKNHLKLLLSVLHPMLRRQQMSYQIFVAEQFGNYTFNKGLLMNAAFLLAINHSNAFDCVIFHDVDLLPESDTNIYGCANSPAHLSVSIDAYGYRLPYSKLVGGVFAISVNHFIQVNGYSNLYWGWGAEDDDMYKRLIANQLPVSRPRPDLAKYKMLQHDSRVRNQFINPLIRTASHRFPQDGLTTCHFRLVSSSAHALFTHFLIDVGQPSYSVLEPNLHIESLVPGSPTHISSLQSRHHSPENKKGAGNHIYSHHHHPHSFPGEGDHHYHHNQEKRKRSSPVDPNSHHDQLFMTPFPERKQDDATNHPGLNNIEEDVGMELPLLSGIAQDTTGNHNHHHKENTYALKHRQLHDKGNKLVKAGSSGKGRQARSLSQPLLSSSSITSLNKHEAVHGKKDTEKQTDGNKWMSLQMTSGMLLMLKERKTGSNQLSLIRSVGSGQADKGHTSESSDALDPNVSVVEYDESDLGDDDVDNAK